MKVLAERRLVLFAASLLFVLALVPSGCSQHALESGRSIRIVGSIWEGRPAQRWSLVVVTIRNAGSSGFKGTVRLVPVANPVTGRVGKPAPLYESPVALKSKGEKRVRVFVGSTDLTLRTEVRDSDRKVVVTGKPIAPNLVGGAQIGILTDAPKISDLLTGDPLSFPLAVNRRFTSRKDFPADPSKLIGLEALVMTDFDTGRLSKAQLKAVSNFVAVGGTLVLTGGSSAAKVTSALPDELAPLRPTGSIESTLGAFAQALAPSSEPAGRAAASGGVIATGELEGGRILIESQGIPLMIEARYGWGRALQLTFDPFATPSAHPLQPPLWKEVLSRSGSTLVNAMAPPAGVSAASREPGSIPFFAELERGLKPKAAPPVAALFVMIVYGLLAGCAVLLPGKPDRGLYRLAALPLSVVSAILFVFAISITSSSNRAVAREIQIHRLGPGGADLVQSEMSVARKVDDVLLLDFTGTVLAWPTPNPVKPPKLVVPSAKSKSSRPTNGDMAAPETPGGLRLNDKRPWSKHRLTMEALVQRPAIVQSDLRLDRGRLVGVITNRGEEAFEKITVQSGRWDALPIAARLAPGASVKVNVEVTERMPRRRQGAESHFQMALRSVDPRSQHVALVGKIRPVRLYTAEGRIPGGNTEAIFVAPVEIKDLDSAG